MINVLNAVLDAGNPNRPTSRRQRWVGVGHCHPSLLSCSTA